MMVSNSVDLPTPLRPSTARLPFSGTSSEMPSSTTASPYPARTSRSVSRGSAMACTMTRFAEVDLAYARIGRDFLGRTFEEDAPADHNDDAARKAEHEVHVVLDEQHRDLAREIRDHLEQFG